MSVPSMMSCISAAVRPVAARAPMIEPADVPAMRGKV
jgi:hypothetical protein